LGLGEKGEWNLDELKIEFQELILADGPITRRTAEAEKPRRLDPYGAVEDKVIFANEDWRTEAERTHRIGDLARMGGVKLADLARRRPQVLEEDIRKIEPSRSHFEPFFANVSGRGEICGPCPMT
jgi:hypothetical protein